MPRLVPPVAFAYQFRVLPELPVAPKVTGPGPHVEPGAVPFMVGVVLMVATTAVLIEVQPLAVASTQNEVVAAILGVKKLVPVPKNVPPVSLLYQFRTLPAVLVAPKVTVPVPQRALGVVVNILGVGFIVKVTVSTGLPQLLVES